MTSELFSINFSQLGIFNANQISELCNSEILSLFNITLKFPSYTTREFKFHKKFRVTLLKETFEVLHKVLCKQLRPA